MAFQLIVVEGPESGREIAVDDRAKLTIGRGDQCDTRLDDAAVSRLHCEIVRQGNVITIRDQGSTSGTRVNGQAIELAELTAGSLVQLGATVLRLTVPGMDDAKILEPASSLPDRPLHELVGSTVGSWRIDDSIGHGVTGMVFKAWNTEKKRVAALKILTPLYSRTEEQRKRFVRAMKAMLPIRNEHIVRLYNAGITGPYCWAAMEFIEGEDLAQLIDRTGIDGMLDWKKVWQVAMDIGLALQAGFEHHVIHRNVTPTNILRRTSDEACLLADFMLAKATEGALAQQITQMGQFVGEISYMAPERTLPDANVDTRSDMYGLGATCYALLTGKPPVSGGSMTEMIDKVCTQVPVPPKEIQLAIDETFQDIVMRMIAKNPDLRFQEPRDLIKELEQVGKFNNLIAS